MFLTELIWVAALFSSTVGQHDKSRSVLEEENFHVLGGKILETHFPRLHGLDPYDLESHILAAASDRVVNDIVKEYHGFDLITSCAYAKKVLGGIDYILHTDILPLVHTEVIRLLDIQKLTGSSLDEDTLQNIAAGQNISVFINNLYSPLLDVLKSMDSSIGKSNSDVQLYHHINHILDETVRIFHVRTAHEFVLEVAVVVYDWMIKNQDPVISVSCESFADDLYSELLKASQEMSLNFAEENLSSIASVSFGQPFSLEVSKEFSLLIQQNMAVFEEPFTVIHTVEQGLFKTDIHTSKARHVYQEILSTILDKVLKSTYVNYVKDETIYNVVHMSSIPMNTSILQISLLDLEPLIIEIHYNLRKVMDPCVDLKFVGALSGLAEIKSSYFSSTNVHTWDLMKKTWDLIHNTHPQLTLKDHTNFNVMFEKFLSEFYSLRMEKFISDLEPLLNGPLPSEMILYDLMFHMWDLKPNTLGELVNLMVKMVFHTLTIDIACPHITYWTEFYEQVVVVVEEFIKSLEITQAYVKEKFSPVVLKSIPPMNDLDQSKVEEFVVTGTNVFVFHVMEDLDLLMMNWKGCSTVEEYRSAFEHFLTGLISYEIHRNLQVTFTRNPPPAYEETQPKPTNPNLFQLVSWQHKTIYNFTRHYMDQVHMMVHSPVDLCLSNPDICAPIRDHHEGELEWQKYPGK